MAVEAALLLAKCCKERVHTYERACSRHYVVEDAVTAQNLACVTTQAPWHILTYMNTQGLQLRTYTSIVLHCRANLLDRLDGALDHGLDCTGNERTYLVTRVHTYAYVQVKEDRSLHTSQ